MYIDEVFVDFFDWVLIYFSSDTALNCLIFSNATQTVSTRIMQLGLLPTPHTVHVVGRLNMEKWPKNDFQSTRWSKKNHSVKNKIILQNTLRPAS